MLAPQNQIPVIKKILVDGFRMPIKRVRKIQAKRSTDQVMGFSVSCFGHVGRDYNILLITLITFNL
jgi:hypothetical protein